MILFCVNFFLGLSCCFLTIFPFNLDPLLSLERKFAEPIFAIKSFFAKNEFPSQVKPKNNYTLVLVGDSMTAMLGEKEIEEELKRFYKDKEIKVINYGVGSTSLDTAINRFAESVIKGDESLNPIFSHNPDVVLLESFGNNPFNLSKEIGLRKQTEKLDKILKTIKEKDPKIVIIFVATIAPSKNYGQGVLELSSKERKEAQELRTAYIKNHIDYAKTHKIPLIDIYRKSFSETDEVKEEYINRSDFIHPSERGIDFINREITNFIFDRRILPL